MTEETFDAMIQQVELADASLRSALYDLGVAKNKLLMWLLTPGLLTAEQAKLAEAMFALLAKKPA